MEKNSFTLRSSGERRVSTAAPVERPWNPPARRIFSSREQLANHENARQLEDYITRIDDPAAYEQDDSRLHRPSSNTRFGAVHIASAEPPDIQTGARASLAHSQDNLSGQAALHEDHTDRSGSQTNDGSESRLSSPDIPPFLDVQNVIDTTFALNRLHEQLQEGFDRMKEEIRSRTSELSKERRNSENLSRDVDTLRQELDEFREREKEIEIQIANQETALKAELSNAERLREENEKLKEQSRRDRNENEKTQSEMKLEIDAFSKDIQVAKRDIRFKEKFLGQIQRDVKNAKEEFDEEVKRRECAEAESNAVKQEYFELQTSYGEEKRKWIALREESEARVTNLEELNEREREKISLLEIATDKEKDARQAVESDLVEVVSFLRRISRAVGHVFHAMTIHGCLDAPPTIDLPVSALIVEEHREFYDIFERLVEVLDGASSLSAVLELAHPYDDALKEFFRVLVMRLVAQSEYICTSDETFRKIESSRALMRSCLQEQRHGLQDVCANFSSQFNTLRLETLWVTEQFCMKVGEVGEEKERVKQELQTQKDKGRAIVCILGKFKEHLSSEKATLLDLKEQITVYHQELRSRSSKNATESSSWRGTLEEVKSGIARLGAACSAFGTKCKNAEDTLKVDIDCLQTALVDKEAKIKDLLQREADLLKAKDELSSYSRKAIADEEEREKRTASLKHDIEKIVKEKSDVVKKLADAEHALQQMSGTVAEALSAKQAALEELIHKKGVVEQLRSELAKGSSKGCDQPSDQQASLGKGSPYVPSENIRNETREDTEADPTPIQGTAVGKNKSTPLSLTAKRAASAKVQRVSSEADPCDVDFVPKKKKKRLSTPNPRKSPRQKATRTEVSKSTPTGKRQLKNPKDGVGLNKPAEVSEGTHNSSSKSAGRDEEWDIELVIGKAEG